MACQLPPNALRSLIDVHPGCRRCASERMADFGIRPALEMSLQKRHPLTTRKPSHRPRERQPGQRRLTRRLELPGGRDVSERTLSPPMHAPPMIQIGVGGDSIYPRARIRVSTQAAECPERPEERVLKQVVGVGAIPGQSYEISQDLHLVPVDEFAERRHGFNHWLWYRSLVSITPAGPSCVRPPAGPCRMTQAREVVC